MNQDRVIALAHKAGISHSCDHYQPDWKCETQDLIDFAALVEQATLERAAVLCGELWMRGVPGHALDCEQAIRNLAKEPQ